MTVPPGVVFVNIDRYTWLVFQLCALLDQRHHNFKPNYTAWSKCIICLKMLWLAQSRWILNFNGSVLAQGRHLMSSRSEVELIPVILCSHTASFQQFTGNVTTSHTSKLLEQIYRYFYRYKSVCVKGANVTYFFLKLLFCKVYWMFFSFNTRITLHFLRGGGGGNFSAQIDVGIICN